MIKVEAEAIIKLSIANNIGVKPSAEVLERF
jgi:hypothetical protein